MVKKRIRIIGGEKETKLFVQVANTKEKREKGLMFVEYLPENEGLLFVFSEKIYGGFWMKNTLIPLSIAFIDTDGKILKILDMELCKVEECPIYNPGIFYRYTIEVNFGWFRRKGIKEGDYVIFD
ncbi:DUF192 domain-containing protein [Lysinibacillus telephonicus]|uniref:DUF192 domain-containing protein n=1 Tax=Lysinibacillus telephonicus TaxID=1714840 RepID=UPI0037D6D5CA